MRVEWIPPLLSMFLEAKVTRGPKRIQISSKILLLNADLQLSEFTPGLLSPRHIDGPWSVTQWERVRLISAGFKNRADERKPDRDTRLYHKMRVKEKSSACLSVMRSQSGFKDWSHFRFKGSETSSTLYLRNVSFVSINLFYICCENFTVFEFFYFYIVYVYQRSACLRRFCIFILNAVYDCSKTGV